MVSGDGVSVSGNSGFAILSKIDGSIVKTAIRREALMCLRVSALVSALFIVSVRVCVILRGLYTWINRTLNTIIEKTIIDKQVQFFKANQAKLTDLSDMSILDAINPQLKQIDHILKQIENLQNEMQEYLRTQQIILTELASMRIELQKQFVQQAQDIIKIKDMFTDQEVADQDLSSVVISVVSGTSDTLNQTLKKIEEQQNEMQEDWLTQQKVLESMHLLVEKQEQHFINTRHTMYDNILEVSDNINEEWVVEKYEKMQKELLIKQKVLNAMQLVEKQTQIEKQESFINTTQAMFNAILDRF